MLRLNRRQRVIMYGMFPVLHWLWTNVAAGFAVLAIGAYTVVPRINARIADVTAAFNDRREFKRRIAALLGLCGRLESELTDSDPVVAENFARERARWLRLMDEHTIWLADNVEWYALGWPNWHLGRFPSPHDLALSVSAAARSIMLANITDEMKVRKIQALTHPAYTVFCQRRTPKSLVSISQEARNLRDLLVELGAWSDSAPVVGAESVPAVGGCSKPAGGPDLTTR